MRESTMVQAWLQEGYQQGYQEGLMLGRAKAYAKLTRNIISKLLEMGYSLEFALKATEFEDVRPLFMSYGNTCKYLAETYPEQFAAWLLGQPLMLSVLEPTELQVEPIRADSLVVLQSSDLVLHLEFQTRPDPEMPLRMLDYWVRLRKKYPTAMLQQYVVYLRETSSPLVHQSEFLSETTQHRFQVVRLWEVEAESLQGYPGLLPLLPLCRGVDPAAALATVQAELLKAAATRQRADLLAATAILAGLKLEKGVIQQILRSPLMRESSMVQAWLEEGRKDALQRIVRNMCNTGMTQAQVAQATGLSVQEVKALLG